MNRLFCVIPCYNEQEVLPETSRRLKDKIEDLVGRKMISPDSRILLVNDGSTSSFRPTTARRPSSAIPMRAISPTKLLPTDCDS